MCLPAFVLLSLVFASSSYAETTVSQTCGKTNYPSLCISALSEFSADKSEAVDGKDLVQISLKSTLQQLRMGRFEVSHVSDLPMDSLVRSAYDDCIELLDGTAHLLCMSLELFPLSNNQLAPSKDDVHTWLSAALTNQDTCMESLDMIPTDHVIKDRMAGKVEDLAKHVSNSLSIYVMTMKNGDFADVPIVDGNRKNSFTEDHFPSWVSRMDRRLLQSTVLPFQPHFLVDKDGNGTHTTITAAVRDAPHNSTERIIIYVKSGRYDENIKVGLSKTNIMFIGDGKGKTVIDGTRSVYDNFTTFHTATFAVTGNGFIARDIAFENSADPNNHQAVALRVGSDHAVFYHCNIIGYQDTLYVHSQRQFFRECDIYGTVDFIFGNAAVVFQNCNIWARKPLDQQKITITAQGRKDPNQNSGISIHACQVIPTLDLQSVASSHPTFLGRPWRLYSRTVYMESYLADHIDQRGWLPWNDDFALDSLYYGEYKNYGPGSKLENRVTWKGYRELQEDEALGFTVGQFIDGSTWLPTTNISFVDSLSSVV